MWDVPFTCSAMNDSSKKQTFVSQQWGKMWALMHL
jgi:hypothetical protein